MTPKVTTAQRRARLMARHLLSGRPLGRLGRRRDRGDGRAARHRPGDRVPVGARPHAVRHHRDGGRGAVRGAADRPDAGHAPDRVRGAGRAPAGGAAGLHGRRRPAAAAAARTRTWKKAASAGPTPRAWLRDTEAAVLRALAARGSATGAQLSADEPRLRTQLVYVPDKSYGGAANITSRVLGLIAAEGHMVRGHRRGGWSSGQFEWFPAAAWLRRRRGGWRRVTPTVAWPGDAGMDAAAARVELARRWLLAFGPALVADLQWWAGWTGGQTKAALGRAAGHATSISTASPASCSPATRTSTMIPGPSRRCCPRSTRRRWAGSPGTGTSARTGRCCSTGPGTSGRPSGGRAGSSAAGRSGRPVRWRTGCSRTPARTRRTAIAAEAARLQSWLGPARVTPRFRTPLERELSS